MCSLTKIIHSYSLKKNSCAEHLGTIIEISNEYFRKERNRYKNIGRNHIIDARLEADEINLSCYVLKKRIEHQILDARLNGSGFVRT